MEIDIIINMVVLSFAVFYLYIGIQQVTYSKENKAREFYTAACIAFIVILTNCVIAVLN
jgi:hypothetical protein